MTENETQRVPILRDLKYKNNILKAVIETNNMGNGSQCSED